MKMTGIAGHERLNEITGEEFVLTKLIKKESEEKESVTLKLANSEVELKELEALNSEAKVTEENPIYIKKDTAFIENTINELKAETESRNNEISLLNTMLTRLTEEKATLVLRLEKTWLVSI